MKQVVKTIKCKIKQGTDIKTLLKLKKQKIMNISMQEDRTISAVILFNSEKRALRNLKSMRKLVDDLEVTNG